MNNTKLRDAIELIGIFGIVLSLIFVGLELRQTSAIARMEARQNYLTPLSEGLRELSTNTELASLVYEQFDNDKAVSDFTAVEIAKLMAFYQSFLNLQYGVYSAVEENILNEDDLEQVFGTAGAYNSNTFRFIWFQFGIKEAYSQEFVQYFESLDWNSHP